MRNFILKIWGLGYSCGGKRFKVKIDFEIGGKRRQLQKLVIS